MDGYMREGWMDGYMREGWMNCGLCIMNWTKSGGAPSYMPSKFQLDEILMKW